MKSSLLFAFALLLSTAIYAEDPSLHVQLDSSEVPHLKTWGEEAQELIRQWHPRVANLLPSKGFQPPRAITLKIKKTDQGVGSTSGTVISISSHWIEKHPEDIGLVFHELVHVIQSYPSGDPWWLTEGIADYLRWGIYEGKVLKWFPRVDKEKGYQKGYRITAGFLVWLESDIAPGIVKKLNAAMRERRYSDEIFVVETGKTINELWTLYIAVRSN